MAEFLKEFGVINVIMLDGGESARAAADPLTTADVVDVWWDSVSAREGWQGAATCDASHPPVASVVSAPSVGRLKVSVNEPHAQDGH